MPTLDLPGLTTGHGMYLAQIAVSAVMTWPTDKTARRRYLATVMAHNLGALEAVAGELPDPAQAADWFETVEAINEHEDWQHTWAFLESWFKRAGGFATVAAAPSVKTYTELMTEHAGDQFGAGLILALVRRMALHPDLPGGPSVNKAIFLLEQVPAPFIPRNAFGLRRAWATYKSVSHFCAVLFDWVRDAMDETDSPESLAVQVEERLTDAFDSFLAEAEAYQNFGLSFRPARSKSLPLLDAAETWVLPANRQWQPTPMVAAPLPDSLLSVLRKYRAPSAY